MFKPTLIISGGQTGADQAGLEAGITLGIAIGGWCPFRGKTEKGDEPILMSKYGLKETAATAYPPRTRLNAQAADGTVWIGTTSSSGYKCTKDAAGDKPFLENPSVVELRAWVEENKILTLNVAGNRESTSPGIFDRTWALIVGAFSD